MGRIAVVERPSIRNTVARVGWAVLTLAAAGYAVFVGMEPMWAINSCELFIAGKPECEQSIFSNFGLWS